MSYPTKLFCDDIPEDLKCPICLEILPLDCQMLYPCQHFFCRNCIVPVVLSDGRCPLDRLEINESSLRKPIPFMVSIIGNLRLRCKFPDCDATMKLIDAGKHETDCEFNPANNRVCHVCSSKITIATKDSHDCNIYFKTLISELQAENAQLKEEISKLQTQEKSLSKSLVSYEQTSPDPSHLSPPLSRDTILRKLDFLHKAIKSLKAPKTFASFYRGYDWEDSPFLKCFLQLVEPNLKITNIFTQTDLSQFFYMKRYQKGFTVEKFKRTPSFRIFHLHVLMFDFLEPILNASSNVLLLDYIDNGMTQWLSRVVRKVTTAVNPTFYDSFRVENSQLPLKAKANYIPFPKDFSRLIDQIMAYPSNYDYIVNFSYLQDWKIQRLMAEFCPNGKCISFNREFFTLKVYSWTPDRQLSAETLLSPQELEFFAPMVDHEH